MKPDRLIFACPIACLGVGWFALLLTVACPAPALSADESDPLQPVVMIPYDPATDPRTANADRYYLGYEMFESMWQRVKEHRRLATTESDATPDDPSDAILSTALYRVRFEKDRLRVSGRLAVTTRGEPWQSLPLSFAGANVTRLELDGADATLRDGRLLIRDPGQHLVVVSFDVPLESGAAIWAIPPSAATLLRVEMDDERAEPLLGDGRPFIKNTPPDGPAIYTAALGSSDRITLTRRLRTEGRAMVRPHVVDIDARLFVAAGLERLEADYRLRFEGQEDNRFAISFDPSLVPVRIEIPHLANWETATGEDGRRILRFTLTRAVKDELHARLIAERLPSANAPPARLFPRLSADALRVEQRRSLLRGAGTTLRARPGPRHRQIPFPGEATDDSGFFPVAAYALENVDGVLAYGVTSERPERSAEVSYVFQAGVDKVETIAQVALRSPEAPLLDARIGLPAGSTIQAVRGNRLRDWWRTGDELFVRFAGPTPRSTNLLVHTSLPIPDETDDIALLPLALEGFEDGEITGSGLVVDHVTRDVVLRLGPSRRIARETGLAENGTGIEVLPPLEPKRAFRFERADFEAVAERRSVEPQFDALWVMLAHVHESWTRLSLRADVEVSRSGVDRVVFTTPDSLPEFRVIGDGVRELRSELVDGVRRYEAVFQQVATGAVSFTLDTELPHDATVSLPDLVFPGANRQERFVVVENRSEERMELAHEGLASIPEARLPYKPSTLQSARLFRAEPSWTLDATLEQLETSAGNAAVILYAELTTALRGNGEEWLSASYHVQNRSLQFLPVIVPDRAELVSAVVAGTEVRADQSEKDGRPVVLVPLIRTEPGQLAYDVKLVFRSRDRQVTKPGQLPRRLERTLDDPEIPGTTIEKTLWNVYLPAGHELVHAGGNMSRVGAKDLIARKLETNLAELRAFNSLAADGSNDFMVRSNALDNGRVLIDRIENQIGKLRPSNRVYDAKTRLLARTGLESAYVKANEELARQKVLVKENRITVDQDRAEVEEGESTGGSRIEWFENSSGIVSRNRANTNARQEQLGRVAGQLRVTDNLSISNDFFVAESSGEEQELAARNYAQIGHVNRDSANAAAAEKLQVLNFGQIGHGGAIAGTAVKKAEAGKGGDADEAVIATGREMQQIRTRIDIEGNDATRDRVVPRRISTDPFAPASEEASDPFASNLGDEERAMDSSALASQAAFRTSGRRTVAVDFPFEGEAYHFEKLKANAVIEVHSARPADSNRTGWSIAFGVCAGFLLLGRGGCRWVQRRRGRSTAAGES